MHKAKVGSSADDKRAWTKEDYEAVADSIRDIGAHADALKKSGLSRTAVVVLLAHATKLSQRDIKIVLDAMNDLTKWALSN